MIKNLNKKLENFRREFKKAELDISSVNKDPFKQFESWFLDAMKLNLIDLNAMTLATVDENGIPAARVVLLKNFDETGFTFYTNLLSEKAREIKKNPNCALVIYWAELERQIRITGVAEKTSIRDAVKYFSTRPRESQIGAWASQQSEKVEIRKILELAFNEMKLKFKNKKIPLPPFWGGFKIVPTKFEFWQGRPNRLHDRILFTKEKNIWKIERLMP